MRFKQEDDGHWTPVEEDKSITDNERTEQATPTPTIGPIKKPTKTRKQLLRDD